MPSNTYNIYYTHVVRPRYTGATPIYLQCTQPIRRPSRLLSARVQSIHQVFVVGQSRKRSSYRAVYLDLRLPPDSTTHCDRLASNLSHFLRHITLAGEQSDEKESFQTSTYISVVSGTEFSPILPGVLLPTP